MSRSTNLPSPEWTLLPDPPAAWGGWLGSLGGGFFLSPLGIPADGIPFFAVLGPEDSPLAVAAGVRRRCRLSRRPRHAYLPTLPAARPDVSPDDAAASLAHRLREEGADEIVLDSYDATWVPTQRGVGEEASGRCEYVVPLETGPDRPPTAASESHRRNIRRGEREGWALARVAGAEAIHLLTEAQRGAIGRASGRGDAFSSSIPSHLLEPEADAPGNSWGARVYVARRDHEPLAVALCGWGAARAFYIMGGSLPEGYRVGAASWLHARIMGDLEAQGIRYYNLGGAPASAHSEDDPSHGLHRFKTGFGTMPSPRRGLRWRFPTPHGGAHALWRATGQRFRAPA